MRVTWISKSPPETSRVPFHESSLGGWLQRRTLNRPSGNPSTPAGSHPGSPALNLWYGGFGEAWGRFFLVRMHKRTPKCHLLCRQEPPGARREADTARGATRRRSSPRASDPREGPAPTGPHPLAPPCQRWPIRARLPQGTAPRTEGSRTSSSISASGAPIISDCA